MAQLTFHVDPDNKLFNFLGLGVGFICNEDGKEYYVFSQDMGKDLMETLLGKDGFVPDHPDVLRISEEMKTANLALTLPELFAKIGEAPKPEQIYTNGFAFVPCMKECKLTIPHGHFYLLSTPLVQVTNLLDGLIILSAALEKTTSPTSTHGVMTPEIAVFLFQKMLEAKLMNDEREVDEELTKIDPLYAQAKRLLKSLGELAESEAEIRRMIFGF